MEKERDSEAVRIASCLSGRIPGSYLVPFSYQLPKSFENLWRFVVAEKRRFNKKTKHPEVGKGFSTKTSHTSLSLI